MDGRGPKAEGKFDKSNSIVFLDFERDRFYVHRGEQFLDSYP